jgi:prophage DNA circulation protein
MSTENEVLLAMLETLEEASYKLAPFFVQSSGIDGGRKQAHHDIADSDRQFIEDMGLKQREYSLNCIIAPRFSEKGKIITSYKNIRDGLLDALEDGSGPGELIHPWYGPIKNIVCKSFNITENLNEVGIGRITIVFAISNTNITPIVEKDEFFGMQLHVVLTLQTLEDAFGDLFKVDPTFSGELKKSIDRVNSFIDEMREKVKPVTELANEINKYNQFLNDFAADASQLVLTPTDLADSIRDSFSTIGALHQTAEATLEAFKKLFDFDDLLPDSNHSTPSSSRQNQNNHVFKAAVQINALANAYLAAAIIDFLTVDEIVTTVSDLEIQFQKIALDPGTPTDVIEKLTDLRTASQGFFDKKKLNASKIIEVDVNPMSVRNLVYLYYGSSDTAEDIARLNNLYDYAYHTGKINILTT